MKQAHEADASHLPIRVTRALPLGNERVNGGKAAGKPELQHGANRGRRP